MATFTAVDKDLLAEALAIAQLAGEDTKTPTKHRAKFRRIAALLWRAHGEKGDEPPPGTGALLARRVGMTQ